VNLEELYLNGNQIKKIGGLAKLPNLRKLNLASNQLSEVKVE